MKNLALLQLLLLPLAGLADAAAETPTGTQQPAVAGAVQAAREHAEDLLQRIVAYGYRQAAPRR
jgi:hypothetical protein